MVKMQILKMLSNSKNYSKGRNSDIKYIVIHYTANNGDTAKGNATYFKNNAVASSAHYFVDENEVYQSVEDCDTAWHCGSKSYRHPFCRNSNSIGIELCSKKTGGKFYFEKKTIENAVVLTDFICKKYGIPLENIIRHYDVTGKNCPAPFVEQNEEWLKFKKSVEGFMTQEDFNRMLDNYFNEQALLVPSSWSENARKWIEGKEAIIGDKNGKRYKSFCTREELAEILYRLMEG